MFTARQRPLLVVEDRLLTVRPSLNTPVLSTAELPSGPARAAIAAFLEGGLRRFAVIVRSLRSGTAVTYELDDADNAQDTDGWTVALDSALSFGESMGFVFDDEMLVDRRPETLRRALAQLHEILAAPSLDGAEDALADDAAIAEPVRELGTPGDLAEILLEDAVEPLDARPAEGARDATGPIERPVAPEGLLSKFRGPAPAPAVSAPAPAAPVAKAVAKAAPKHGPATLGRVRPVRVRLDGETSPRIDPLLRLLADF